MIDLSHFTLRDMTELGGELRALGGDAGTLTGFAARVTRHLHERLLTCDGRVRACPLVRFFKTHPLGELPEPWRGFAEAHVDPDASGRETPCMSLLGTAGERPGWCDVARSRRHLALPLRSPAAVGRIPMMTAMLDAFGVHVSKGANTGDLVIETEGDSFGVFHVPVALGSPQIPDQNGFVIPEQIASAVGFGGRLPSGSVFAVILFSRIPIPAETARLFRVLALSTKAAAIPYDRAIFGRPG